MPKTMVVKVFLRCYKKKNGTLDWNFHA